MVHVKAALCTFVLYCVLLLYCIVYFTLNVFFSTVYCRLWCSCQFGFFHQTRLVKTLWCSVMMKTVLIYIVILRKWWQRVWTNDWPRIAWAWVPINLPKIHQTCQKPSLWYRHVLMLTRLIPSSFIFILCKLWQRIWTNDRPGLRGCVIRLCLLKCGYVSVNLPYSSDWELLGSILLKFTPLCISMPSNVCCVRPICIYWSDNGARRHICTLGKKINLCPLVIILQYL